MEEAADRWAFNEFGHAALGNGLRTKRLVRIAAMAMERPSGKVTEVFREAAPREAAFRFVESDAVDEASLKGAAHDAGAKRCADVPFAYIAVDKSSLTLPGRPGTTDFGMVASSRMAVHGVLVMSALAVTPDGTPQGIVAQNYWTRPVKKKASRIERRKVPISDSETQYWLDAMSSAVAHFTTQAPNCRPWFQIDREGDATAVLSWAVEHDQWLTVRAKHDRRVDLDDVQRNYLWQTMSDQLVLGRYAVEVTAQQGRQARRATMTVRAAQLDISVPKFNSRREQDRELRSLHVVLAREEQTTPSGEEPLEWMLLTTRKASSFETACEVLFGYTQRWRVEEFHRMWKSGACRVEESQLRETDHFVRWAIVLASVAVRLLRMSYLARSSQSIAASKEFTPAEIKAVLVLRKPKSIPPYLTVAQLVLWIAELGSYTGAASSGGPPGPLVLARGFKDVLVDQAGSDELAKT
jgi:hypothetical protein